jgi:hypothetical protein
MANRMGGTMDPNDEPEGEVPYWEEAMVIRDGSKITAVCKLHRSHLPHRCLTVISSGT